MMAFMKYALMMVMALGLVLPGNAGEREEALLNGLFNLGARALEVQVDRPAAEETVAAPAAQASAPAPAAAVSAAPQPLSMVQMFAGSVKQAVDGIINEYKEEYKEEGRAYAREVGDIVVERVVQDPEINATITSLRTLCWFVVAYLTLVTFVMLGCLVYLKRANARLLEEVRRMR